MIRNTKDVFLFGGFWRKKTSMYRKKVNLWQEEELVLISLRVNKFLYQ